MVWGFPADRGVRRVALAGWDDRAPGPRLHDLVAQPPKRGEVPELAGTAIGPYRLAVAATDHGQGITCVRRPTRVEHCGGGAPVGD